jgi:hypothetical protein
LELETLQPGLTDDACCLGSTSKILLAKSAV